ncbi:MAG: tRNA (adenosine(37)-N6)-dimethylallyltransferase MiaA [Acidimicrobiia bacterium]
MTTTHLALVGPTASGKSVAALAIARELGDVEIVSVDSMQGYREMDIGTAKPSAAEQAAVRHHLLDIADPAEDLNVARYQELARAAVADIAGRGKRALLVGGTGLYFQAVVDDLRFPGEDLELRAELERRTAEPGGIAAAYTELERLDPLAASRIDPHNARRVVRALEVIELTGEPFSSFGPGVQSFGPTAFPVHLVGLWLPREALVGRIAERVAVMRERGLWAEVERLRRLPAWSRTARQAIGYKEILDVIDRGDGGAASDAAAVDDAFETIARRTRSFARRQRMWFRRDPRITWVGGGGNPCGRVGAVLALWRR